MEHDTTPTPPPPPPPPSSAAPVTRGAMPVTPPRSSWPTVLGIFCIVFGGLGIITYGLCQPAGLLMGPIMAGALDTAAQNNPQMQGTADSMDAMSQNLIPNLIAAITGAFLAVMLLVGGIKLSNRKPGAAKILVYWAVFKMVWAVGAIILGVMNMNLQMEQMEKMAASNGGQQMPQGFVEIFSSLGYVGQFVGFAIYCALPITCLFFLLRSKSRNEMASWTVGTNAQYQHHRSP